MTKAAGDLCFFVSLLIVCCHGFLVHTRTRTRSAPLPTRKATVTAATTAIVASSDDTQVEVDGDSLVELSNGLHARRVDVPYLRHDLLDSLSGRPVSFYEIVNWEVKEGNQSFYVTNSFTYGSKIWPSNLAIAKRMCTESDFVKDKVVLDAGCGVGLSSIVAGLLHAKEVIAMDISNLCLELVQAACKKHNLDNVKLCNFDLLGSDPLPQADVVLFGDVLYTPELGEAVARRVREAQARGSHVLLGSMPHRHGKKWFLNELNDKKYGADKIFFSPDDTLSTEILREMGWKGKEIEVIELNKPEIFPAVFLVNEVPQMGEGDNKELEEMNEDLYDLIKNSDIPRSPETDDEIEDDSFEGFLKMQFMNIIGSNIDNAKKNSDGKLVLTFAQYFEWKTKMGLVLKEAEVMDVFNILTGNREECTLMEFITITKTVDEANAAADENEDGFFF